MGVGSHNGSCARAVKHACQCTGCGGSQHGWQGWLAVAGAPPADREDQRRRYEERLARDRGPHGGGVNQKVRATVTDLARLDIADWLATGIRDETPGHDRTAQARRPDHATNIRISPFCQVDAFAEAMTKDAWQEIGAELDRDVSRSREIKRELANHVWCDLFVGLVRAIEISQGVLNRLPDAATDIVKQVILGSTLQGGRAHVTEAVVDIVVSRVWRAFRTATFNAVPLLNIVGSEEALRALRILAVFICPAPGRHLEVREYALKPLGSDIHDILTEQTKARLAELFADWRVAPG